MATPTFPQETSGTDECAVVSHAPRDSPGESYLPEIFRGVGVSMKHFLREHTRMLRASAPIGPRPLRRRNYTICYPEQKRALPERFRGVHRLTTRTDGSMRCVPACVFHSLPRAMHLHRSAIRKGTATRLRALSVRFVIDELRCIFAGTRVEACPATPSGWTRACTRSPTTPATSSLRSRPPPVVQGPGRDVRNDESRHEPGIPRTRGSRGRYTLAMRPRLAALGVAMWGLAWVRCACR